jgi:hypothetical protein
MELGSPHIVDTNQVEWEEVKQPWYAKPIRRKVLRRDPETGAVHLLINYPAGLNAPAHHHSCSHTLFVLENELTINGRAYPAGTYAHFPAGEIWSVVHFPFAFSSTGTSRISSPSHAGNGGRACRRLLVGLILTTAVAPFPDGGTYPCSPSAKPRGGSSAPIGGSSFTFSPRSFSSESVTGLNVSRPASANAVTISGLATNA